MKNWRIYQNYAIIAILSFISVFFLPMLGSTAGLALNLPNTIIGWIVYCITKACIVVINMLLLDQFIKQAKVNIRDNERYKEADAYFNANKEENETILPPKEFLSRLYRNKMISSLIMSVLGVFGLSHAILTFDWVSMLTYLFTIVMGLIFGWITMNRVEDYWTNDYYRLYKRHEKQDKEALELAKKELNKQGNASVHNNRGTNLLEPSNCDSNTSNLQPMVVDGGDRNNSVLGGTTNSSCTTTDSTDIRIEETMENNNKQEVQEQ